MRAINLGKMRTISVKEVLFLLPILAIPQTITAQEMDNSQSSYTDISQYLLEHPNVPTVAAAPTPGVLSSSVTQIGQNNVATATLAGQSNITTQYQNGSYNSSALSINGTQNSITNSQVGNSNTTAISIVGNGNSISNLQVGSGLSYQLQVVGTSAPVSVQQFGRR